MEKEKEKPKFDRYVLLMLLVILGSISLFGFGLYTMINCIFTGDYNSMFNGIVFTSLGLILVLVIVLIIAYQSNIAKMDEYIGKANKIIENQNIYIQGLSGRFNPSIGGGEIEDVSPEERNRRNNKIINRNLGKKEMNPLSEMTMRKLQSELKKAESVEDYEKAAELRDEIDRRNLK